MCIRLAGKGVIKFLTIIYILFAFAFNVWSNETKKEKVAINKHEQKYRLYGTVDKEFFIGYLFNQVFVKLQFKLWSRLCEVIFSKFSCNSMNGGLNFGFSLIQRSEMFHNSAIVSTLLYPLRLCGLWKSWPKLRFPFSFTHFPSLYRYEKMCYTINPIFQATQFHLIWKVWPR